MQVMGTANRQLCNRVRASPTPVRAAHSRMLPASSGAIAPCPAHHQACRLPTHCWTTCVHDRTHRNCHVIGLAA